jgi:hypothetical protein
LTSHNPTPFMSDAFSTSPLANTGKVITSS